MRKGVALVLVAVFAAVLFAAAALGAGGGHRPAAGSYGGGQIDTAYRQEKGSTLSNALITWVSARVSKGGGSARFFVRIDQRCTPAIDRQDQFFNEYSAPVKIAEDGTFRTRAKFKTTFKDRPTDASLTLRGAFQPGGRASGTLRALEVRSKADDGSINRCVSKPVHFELRKIGDLSKPDGRVSPGAAYYGLAAKRSMPSEANGGRGKLFVLRLPLMLRVSKDGKKMALAGWYWTNQCTSDIRDFRVNYSHPATIRPDGSFSAPEKYDTDFDDVVGHNTVTFKGKFGPRGVSGVYRLKSVYTNKSDGTLNDTCDTGLVRWRAVR